MYRKKLTTALLSSALLFHAISPASIALASEPDKNIPLVEENVVQSNVLSPQTASEKLPYQNFDPYVKVKNNQYVLQLPQAAQVSAVDIIAVNAYISKANTIVAEDNLTINPETKVASTSSFSLYSAGVNKVTVHWNYARVYLSKSTVNNAIAGATSGLGVILGGIPGVGLGTSVAMAVVIGIVGNQEVNNGIWFDYNYFNGIFTNNWGWQ